ncbi:MAG: MFS transporter [Burkholderiales bacterium]
MAAQPVATDSYLPALPAIRAELGNAAVSLTVFVLAMGIGQLPSGPLSDRIGRRPVLLGGLALYALAAFGAALASNVEMLVVARALQGVAMGATLVCARAAVRDVYTAIEGAHALARGMTGVGAVALSSPIVGAVLVEFVGWRSVFVLMGAYALALLALCTGRFGETRVLAAPGSVARRGVREVFGNASFRAWGSVAVATYAGIFAFLLLSPAVYISYLGLSPTQYAWIPAGGALVYIVSTTLCRRLLLRFGALRTEQFGACLSLLGALIQAAGCLWAPRSLWPLLLGHAAFTFGHGIHQPCGQSGAVAELPHAAGRAVAWHGFSMMLVAFACGQIAASFVDDAATWGAWPMVAPIVLAAVALTVIAWGWLPRVERRPEPQ